MKNLGRIVDEYSNVRVGYCEENYINNLADAYSTSKTYSAGAVVMYKNKRYVCKADIASPEAWTSSHWTATTVEAALDTKVSKASPVIIAEFGEA